LKKLFDSMCNLTMNNEQSVRLSVSVAIFYVEESKPSNPLGKAC